MALLSLLVVSLMTGEGVAWKKDYAQAFQEAAERNVPLLVAFNMDGEGANTWTAEKLYRDPRFVERSRHLVCLIASIGEHGEGECSRFGAVSCAEHKKIEIAASDEFIGKDEVIAPQHLLIAPGDRRVLCRKAYQASLDELLKLIRMAEKAVKRGTTPDANDLPPEHLNEYARLDELRELVEERNAERREPAIRELGTMELIEARELLCELTGPSYMDATRIEAIRSLASKGNFDALPVLVDLLRDRNSMVLAEAIRALGVLELPGARAELMRLWKKKPKSIIAKEIPGAMVKCAPNDADVQKAMYRAIKSKDTVVRLHSLIAMRDMPADEKVDKALLKGLRDRSGNVRALSAWCLGMRECPEAVPALEKLARSENNAEVRECIAAAIAQIKDPKETCSLEHMTWRFLP